MFVALCSHVLVVVKLVYIYIYIYIYSCIVTELINENNFHQFLIWYQSDILSASNFLRVSQINFGNTLFFSFTIVIFLEVFNSLFFSFTIIIFFELFLSTIVVFYKLLKLFNGRNNRS